MQKIPFAAQIAGLMTLVLIVAMGVNYFQDVRMLQQVSRTSDRAKAESAASTVKTLVKNNGASLQAISRALRANQVINQAMAEYGGSGNPRGLSEALHKLYPELGVGLLMVIDHNKTVIYRAHGPEAFGDKMDFPGLAEALSGKEIMLSYKEPSQGLSTRVLAPITLPNRKIAGVLVLGTRFDDDFVRKLAADAGAEISFASASGVWASSLQGDAKKTLSADAANIAKRLDDGAGAFIDDHVAGTARWYTPLRILDETVILIVQMDTRASAKLQRDNEDNLLWMSIVLLLVCAVPGAVLANFLTRPRRLQQELQRLSKTYASDNAGAGRNKPPAATSMQALQVAAKLLAQHADESQAAREKAEFSAQYDALTRLPNRSLMRDRLNLALAAAARNHSLVAFMFADLDKFKPINDTLGHDVGDQVLQEAATRLRECVREQDTVARLGGDEFVVILPNMKNTEDAATVARNILTSVNRPSAYTGSSGLNVSASIGIGVYPADAANAEDLIKCADAAMYHTKEGGRNGYRFFAPEMNSRVNATLALENGMRLALERNEFELHYQPQVSLAGGQIIGVEALLRWRHPERGLLTPAAFIHVAEERSLILPIGEWVLRTACRQNRAWQDEGLTPVPVAVNVSSLQFRKKEFSEIVSGALHDSGLAARYLDLEITEGALMHDTETTNASIGAFKSMGLALSIDDFGTGHSSVAYLKRLAISRLKIDHSFVGNVPRDENDAAIVSTIIAMAHSLKLDVIAEGVETAEQADFLSAAGCDKAQGYYFGKPVPAEEFSSLLHHATIKTS